MYSHLKLTARELEILIWLAKTGKSTKELAEQMCLSEKTIENYIGRIISKLGVENRTQAVIYAYCVGLVEKCEGFPPLQHDD
ncbi:MAG: helix-turn-helix transcriptional regulator [Caldilineaceae bacterium]|nr:helix-turn-helix transcriptional regulator [Caldilineaceae bacterium]